MIVDIENVKKKNLMAKTTISNLKIFLTFSDMSTLRHLTPSLLVVADDIYL